MKKANTLVETIKSAMESKNVNEHLCNALSIVSSRLIERDRANNAAQKVAAMLLGIETDVSNKRGSATVKGFGLLLANGTPVRNALMAIAKNDIASKNAMFWALDAMRRSAAYEAYRAYTSNNTATEQQEAARMILSEFGEIGQYESEHFQPNTEEPYASGFESELYPVGGKTARDEFLEDSELWEALALLLSTNANEVPALARFWSEGLNPTICNTWEDIEAYMTRPRD